MHVTKDKKWDASPLLTAVEAFPSEWTVNTLIVTVCFVVPGDVQWLDDIGQVKRDGKRVAMVRIVLGEQVGLRARRLTQLRRSCSTRQSIRRTDHH